MVHAVFIAVARGDGRLRCNTETRRHPSFIPVVPIVITAPDFLFAIVDINVEFPVLPYLEWDTFACNRLLALNLLIF